MRKIFTLRANEGWIIDHMVDEWENFLTENSKSLVPVFDNTVDNETLIWILPDFCWRHLPKQLLENKQQKIVVTIHHIVPEKFNAAARQDFFERDKCVRYYHVFNDEMKQFLIDECKISKDRIVFIPYWHNDKFWKRDINFDVEKNRKDIGLSKDDFVIFSAQRDTEGFDLKTPKREKGPDLLAEAIIKLSKHHPNLKVLLGGWRRQYIMDRLDKAEIEFKFNKSMFKDFAPREEVRDAYQMADLYIVASRCEGGPQALLECGAMGLKTISRPVGIAEQVLPSSAINSDVWLASPAIRDVSRLTMDKVFPQYVDFFEAL